MAYSANRFQIKLLSILRGCCNDKYNVNDAPLKLHGNKFSQIVFECANSSKTCDKSICH